MRLAHAIHARAALALLSVPPDVIWMGRGLPLGHQHGLRVYNELNYGFRGHVWLTLESLAHQVRLI